MSLQTQQLTVSDKENRWGLGLSARSGLILSLVVALGVIAALGLFFWVGYMGTDDSAYVDGALSWYRHFPYVGRSHWEVRYPILFMIDFGFAVFGINEPAIGISMLIYLFGIVALS